MLSAVSVKPELERREDYYPCVRRRVGHFSIIPVYFKCLFSFRPKMGRILNFMETITHELNFSSIVLDKMGFFQPKSLDFYFPISL